MRTKIFCIGFHKTGTKSLATALSKLGYSITGPNGVKDSNISWNVYTMAHKLVKKYDAFQDNPWPIIYKKMDKAYPGSKFILTIRDSESWIKSLVRHFGKSKTPMRKWIYGIGCPKGNEETYMRIFENHNKEVIAYFKERSSDLLVLDLAKGNGWEQLCPFLGKEIPNIPFPHINKAEVREKEDRWDRKVAKKSRNLITHLMNKILGIF